MTRTADLRRLGSVYGGAWVPTASLLPGAIVYCVGLGMDATFDFELVERFGAKVWAFDPTPSVIEWIGHQDAPPGFTFMPYGVWNEDRTARFYSPENPSHVSHSIDNIQGTTSYFEAEVRRVSTIMQELEHRAVDMLKLNIEGAEAAVLEDLFSSGVSVRILSIVFEQNESPWKLRKRVRRVVDAGYELRHVEAWHYTFVRAGA